MKGILL